MTQHEADQWMVYWRETPCDPESLYHRPVAILAAIIANQNRDPKRRPDPYTARDCMPWHERLDHDAADEAPGLLNNFREFHKRHNEGLQNKPDQ